MAVPTNNKYEFVESDTIELEGGTILRRIRALTQLGQSVFPGDLGGYLENEGNLDSEGLAWVYDDACVYGKARVGENARAARNRHGDRNQSVSRPG